MSQHESNLLEHNKTRSQKSHEESIRNEEGTQENGQHTQGLKIDFSIEA
jgi:hypothetical protein